MTAGKSPQRKFWPYDEVTASRDLQSPSKFTLSAPWLTFQFDVNAEDIERADLISKKISSQQLSADDLPELNWLFSSMASYPFAYVLPRPEIEGTDQHNSLPPLPSQIPSQLISSLNLDYKNANELTPEWTWDTEAALGFSQTAGGFDPESLFSIARRFHLLNDFENNKTAELLNYVKSLESNKHKFRETTALIMRQNHYITQKCEPVLSAALPLAQNSREEVLHFIRAEAGHDKILAKALKALGAEPEQVPVLNSVSVLMDLFLLVGQRNFLAFSMVVDIFERTSYRDQDPFATALIEGGEAKAASQIEVHREINDSGGHENVAIGFLKDMAPVNADYAVEALRLAELLTQVIHSISKDTLTILKN